MTTLKDDKALLPEEWRDVPDYEGLYQASSLGKIRSLDRTAVGAYRTRNIKGVLRIPRTGRDGYLASRLSKNGIKLSVTWHRIIAATFLGKKDLQVNHKNGIKSDNRIENLEYVTNRMNQLHKNKPASGYTGVYRQGDRYHARISIDNKRIHLGVFDNPEDASKAYIEKVSLIDEVKYGQYAN